MRIEHPKPQCAIAHEDLGFFINDEIGHYRQTLIGLK
jgi:hypothetical protein